jgi:hypothetical protein
MLSKLNQRKGQEKNLRKSKNIWKKLNKMAMLDYLLLKDLQLKNKMRNHLQLNKENQKNR